MGILSEEKAQELISKIDSDGLSDAEVSPSDPPLDVKQGETEAPERVEEKAEAVETDVAEVPQQVEAAKAETGNGEGQEVSDSSDGDDDGKSDLPGHRVPYKRFKSVLDSKNRFREESVEAKAQLDAFKRQMEVMRNEVAALRNLQPAKPAEPAKSEADEIDAELARLLGDSGHEGPSIDKRAVNERAALEKRIYDLERERERSRLESEVRQMTGKYTSIPEKELQQVLLHAVSRDPTVSLLDVAEQYVTWKTGIEEAAIARHLKENPGSTVQEAVEAAGASSDVPPRPARTGTGAARASAGQQTKIGTIKEGSTALMRALRDGSINLFG